MEKGDFINDGYKILQSVEINGYEIITAENLDKDVQKYMAWRRSLDQPFGAESHIMLTYSSDYLTVFREFIRTQSLCADSLDLDRVYRGGPVKDYALDLADCVPGGKDADMKGKVVAVNAAVLSPEYRSQSHQLGGWRVRLRSERARQNRVWRQSLFGRT